MTYNVLCGTLNFAQSIMLRPACIVRWDIKPIQSNLMVCMIGVVVVWWRLIINDDLEKGTQMPYIERALKEGYEVLVLNTNLNRWPDGSDHRAEAMWIPVCVSL